MDSRHGEGLLLLLGNLNLMRACMQITGHSGSSRHSPIFERLAVRFTTKGVGKRLRDEFQVDNPPK